MPTDAAGTTTVVPMGELSALTHDARNMVTALGIYCELLRQPGVLNPNAKSLIGELKLITDASRRLVDEMAALASESPRPGASRSEPAAPQSAQPLQRSASESLPINNLARELRANQNLLAALAGPSIRLRLRTTGGELPVRLRSEELTRVLVNLVRNAAEAMPGGGELEIRLSEAPALESGKSAGKLLLRVVDSGPGIAEELREAVFTAGFSGHAESDPDSNWHGQHRGLGLAITRAVLNSSGGSIHIAPAERGSCFEIQLPTGH